MKTLPTIKRAFFFLIGIFSPCRKTTYHFLVVCAVTFVFCCSLHGRAFSYLLVFPLCTGFAWDRAKFLHSSLCGAVLDLCWKWGQKYRDDFIMAE